MIDLVIVSKTDTEAARAMTQRCIDSFRDTCIGNVIVVEETDQKYQAEMIRQPHPFNYNQCMNLGAKKSRSEWICFANNDCEFLPGWDQIIDYGYDSVSPMNPGWFKQAGLTGVQEGYEVGKHVCGWCIVIKRTILEKIQYFPTDVQFWYSDNLYADVLRFHGIKHALITDCKVKHTPSVSLLQSDEMEQLTDGQLSKYLKARMRWIGTSYLEFATIDHAGAFNKYLGQNIPANLTVYPSTDSSARVYNEHIRKSKAHYICFIHSDVTLSGFEDAIKRTIKQVPDFGALGAVGSNKGTKWGRQGNIQEVITVDSCCIVINRDHGLFFDEKTFSGYHLYCENYCMEIRSRGLKVYTIDCNAYEGEPGLIPVEPYFIHHSQTLNTIGHAWGEYAKFRRILGEKWPDIETS